MDIPWLNSASKRQRYLVGVSGGMDSVALVHLLVEAGFRNLIVCHLDHRLRGRASATDARFVDRLAGRLDLPVERGRADVKWRMAETSKSMETAARAARQEFFADCARRHRCNRVLLGQHADDQAETVLWNLLRGSHGLRGMREEQTIRVDRKRLTLIRPLLGLRKQALKEWLEARNLVWREDATNAEPVAIRNRLRHEALPLLEEIAGRDPVEALVRAAEDFAEWRAHGEAVLATKRLLDPQGRLHLPTLRKLPPVLQRQALAEFLKQAGVAPVDRDLLQRGCAMLDVSHPSVINLPADRRLRRREGRMWVE